MAKRVSGKQITQGRGSSGGMTVFGGGPTVNGRLTLGVENRGNDSLKVRGNTIKEPIKSRRSTGSIGKNTETARTARIPSP